MEYLVDWVGYPPSECSWEDRDHLNCDALLAGYENKRISQLQNAQENTDGNLDDLREELKALEDTVNRIKQQEKQQAKQGESEQQSRPQPDELPDLIQIPEFEVESIEAQPIQHHQATQKAKVPCKGCNRLFSNVYACNRHFNNFHAATSTKKLKNNPDTPVPKWPKCFECTQCGMWFTRLEGLQKHTSRAHPNPSAPENICSLCGKKFVSEYNLRDHKQICRRRQSAPNSTTTSTNIPSPDTADANNNA